MVMTKGGDGTWTVTVGLMEMLAAYRRGLWLELPGCWIRLDQFRPYAIVSSIRLRNNLHFTVWKR